MQMPRRPKPKDKITDYDDGDPYSCMAVGRAELDLQISLQKRVSACYGRSDEALQPLLEQDPASVKTALYDIWSENRGAPLANWAADHMERLGSPQLKQFDQAHPRRRT